MTDAAATSPKPKTWRAEWMRLQFHLMTRRRELGITQPDLARTLGVSRSSLQRWEHGKALPNGHELFRWADALDISITSELRKSVSIDAIEFAS